LLLSTLSLSNLASNFSFSSNPLGAYDSLYSFLLESISSLFSSGLPPSRKRVIPSARILVPWWNDLCAEAVEHRRSLLRMYRSNPTLDNWSAYRRESLSCRRILRREKLLGWKRLCAEFIHKTSTAEIWRFIRSYKNKSLSSNSPPDNSSLLQSQNSLLNKLCPPSCLHSCSIPLHILKAQDPSDSPLSWLDDSFTLHELESAIHSFKRNSSPGLDRVDYSILHALPPNFRNSLLSIYNDLFSRGFFPDSWRKSLLVFLPKSGGRGVRPISLLSYFLKLLERLVYRRLQWAIETRFLLPEFQFGFRSSRSCVDNLVILTNRVQTAFLKGASILAVFLDIEGAFDSVISSILVQIFGIWGSLLKFASSLKTC